MRHGIIDDLCKQLSELRKKFQYAGFANAETLVPKQGVGRGGCLPPPHEVDISQRLMIKYVVFGKKEEKWTQKRCWRFLAQWL